MTVKSYYKNFISIYGALVGSLGALPFLSELLPGDWAQSVFPPLGGVEPYSKFATLVLAGAITLIVYTMNTSSFVSSKRGRSKSMWLVFAIAVIALTIFFVSTQAFVRGIDIPSVGKRVVVSVGYDRTEFARTIFKDRSDEEMLRARGMSEEEIWRLWTTKSIIVARSLLFLSYLIFILSAVAFVSLGALFDKLGAPPNA